MGLILAVPKDCLSIWLITTINHKEKGSLIWWQLKS